MSSYIVRHADQVQGQSCPCGSSQRIITKKDFPEAGFHITHIKEAKKHYHKNTTEIYHILDGYGTLEVDGDEISLTPGLTIVIPKGTPHRGEGDFKTVIVTLPAFDSQDEFILEE